MPNASKRLLAGAISWRIVVADDADVAASSSLLIDQLKAQLRRANLLRFSPDDLRVMPDDDRVLLFLLLRLRLLLGIRLLSIRRLAIGCLGIRGFLVADSI